MADGRLMAQPGVGSAQLGRHPGVSHGEALDVHLVDDRVRVRVPGPGAVAPAIRLVYHQAARHVRRRIQRARRVGVAAGRIPQHLGPEAHRPGQRPGVRVQQQLGRVAAHAPGRVIRAGGPVPVGLPGPDPRHETMPDTRVVVPQPDLRFRAGLVEQAHLHPVGDGGGHREVRPAITDGGTQREMAAGQRDRGRPDRGGHGWAFPAMSRRTSPRGRTAPWRRRITSAIRPVQPVWWKAPIAAPLSPWKYSLKIRLSFQAGSVCIFSVPPKQARRPSASRVNSEISRSCRSAMIRSRVSRLPEPVGYSISKSSP